MTVTEFELMGLESDSIGALSLLKEIGVCLGSQLMVPTLSLWGWD